MSISDRILGKKNVNGHPHIEAVAPAAALPGGEVKILGTGLRPPELRRPSVLFGDMEAPVIISSDDFVVARVPQGAASGPVVISTNGHASNAHQVKVAGLIAENLHPVSNPAIDAEGNIYVTFSGSRGQKVPVAIFKIDTNYNIKPFVVELMNATAIAFDRAGQMYVSSRYDGTVYRVAPNGTMSSYAESMGVATGIAFDREENLYVGDRSGTIFKIARDRQIFVFATLEPSVSAYHLAFGPHGDLFITGPTQSSFDAIYKVDPHGAVSVFYRGLGRPQGLAFDCDGNLYAAASLGGKRGIVRITPDGNASLAVAGPGLVGLAFAAGRSAILASNNAVHHLAWDVAGLPLLAPS
ncbi:MAG TPA: IPT/TIG domain-containing protein [Terriglobales bacterium]|jgi:sugar lactone lactonase YvrE|nr:IPT/TIG domain-containing protein [Terriglobales bacterium]